MADDEIELIVVSSLFKLKLITETYQWMPKLTTRPEHSLRTLQQYLGFNTTRKRFEPGHNLFTFPVVHSAPLKYNCSYHRNHISLKSYFIHILNQEVERLRLI